MFNLSRLQLEVPLLRGVLDWEDVHPGSEAEWVTDSKDWPEIGGWGGLQKNVKFGFAKLSESRFPFLVHTRPQQREAGREGWLGTETVLCSDLFFSRTFLPLISLPFAHPPRCSEPIWTPYPGTTRSTTDPRYLNWVGFVPYLTPNSAFYQSFIARLLKSTPDALPPNDHLVCIDEVLAGSEMTGGDPYSEFVQGLGGWKYIGTHMHFRDELVEQGRVVLRKVFGVGEEEEVPPVSFVRIISLLRTKTSLTWTFALFFCPVHRRSHPVRFASRRRALSRPSLFLLRLLTPFFDSPLLPDTETSSKNTVPRTQGTGFATPSPNTPTESLDCRTRWSRRGSLQPQTSWFSRTSWTTRSLRR